MTIDEEADVTQTGEIEPPTAVIDHSQNCEACGIAFERASGPGRPRRFCLKCSPRDPVETNRAWRRRNREAINARRRKATA